MSNWYLVIDDMRELAGPDLAHLNKELPWVIARTVDAAISLIQEKGCPLHIAFDHDLGEDPITHKTVEAMILAKWLTNEIMEGRLSIPEGFDFSVHSSNPAGRKNIESFMRSFLKIWKQQ